MSMVPVTNDAPGLFSTTKGTPICADICCTRIRVSTSTEPPGADGTTKRIGFSGYATPAAMPWTKRNAAMSRRSGITLFCNNSGAQAEERRERDERQAGGKRDRGAHAEQLDHHAEGEGRERLHRAREHAEHAEPMAVAG